MIVQAELQIMVATIGHNNYKVQRKLHKYHMVICSPLLVLLLISSCFTSRLCATILEAEVDVTRQVMMPILSVILGYSRGQGCALESWFYFLPFTLGNPVSAVSQKTLRS